MRFSKYIIKAKQKQERLEDTFFNFWTVTDFLAVSANLNKNWNTKSRSDKWFLKGREKQPKKPSQKFFLPEALIYFHYILVTIYI